MTIRTSAPPAANLARDVFIGSDPDVLHSIHDPGVAAAIWRRRPPDGLQPWLDRLPAERLPTARTILPVTAVAAAVHAACDEAGTPRCAERDSLADDVSALATLFSGLLQASHLQLRFDVVDDNACTKFHIDNVPARLLCTYRGRGTEYGSARGRPEPERIRTVPTGAVAILRGAQWPAAERSDLLHRSPPIEGSGATRLLLVLDPVDPAEAP